MSERKARCSTCWTKQHGCACDGAFDAGCFLCTPNSFEEPPCTCVYLSDNWWVNQLYAWSAANIADVMEGAQQNKTPVQFLRSSGDLMTGTIDKGHSGFAGRVTGVKFDTPDGPRWKGIHTDVLLEMNPHLGIPSMIHLRPEEERCRDTYFSWKETRDAYQREVQDFTDDCCDLPTSEKLRFAARVFDDGKFKIAKPILEMALLEIQGHLSKQDDNDRHD